MQRLADAVSGFVSSEPRPGPTPEPDGPPGFPLHPNKTCTPDSAPHRRNPPLERRRSPRPLAKAQSASQPCMSELKQEPEAVDCQKSMEIEGRSNQINQDVTPKILHDVENVFQHMSGTQASADTKKNVAGICKAIYRNYGDITRNCFLESDQMKALLVVGICMVIENLQKKYLTDLDSDDLDTYYQVVIDAKNMNVDVHWLLKRLDEIKEARVSVHEVKALGMTSDKLHENIKRKNEEISLLNIEKDRLVSKIQEIEDQVAQDSSTIGTLNQQIIARLKCLQFLHVHLMDGLVNSIE